MTWRQPRWRKAKEFAAILAQNRTCCRWSASRCNGRNVIAGDGFGRGISLADDDLVDDGGRKEW